MKPLSVRGIVEAVGGSLMPGTEIHDSVSLMPGTEEGNFDSLMPDTNVLRVVTDSRKIQAGDLYVPIVGERFDGHDFIDNAFENGAVLALSAIEAAFKGPVVCVKDTRVALGSLAAYHRSRFDIPVIGITGSVGKTSTKEMMASILGTKFRVHKTAGNFNNDIGLPLTLLGLEEDHEVAIVELGMNHFGEIDYLASLLKPTHGMISNIGVSHIEFLGSREGILKAKMEMVPHIQEDGLLVLNGDDDLLSKVGIVEGHEVVYYSDEHQMDCLMTDYDTDEDGGQHMTAQTMKHVYQVKVDYPGRHILHNALGCILIAERLGVSHQEMVRGLENYVPAAMRLNRRKLKDGSLILDDAYNASVDSMESALNTLTVMGEGYGQKIAVLGSMFEMGTYAQKGHERVGLAVAKEGPDHLICIGDDAQFIGSSAVDAGYPEEKVHRCPVFEGSGEVLLSLMKPKSLVLIKASRGMALERLRDLLIERFEEV